jgi:uracil phosphoribosyltransferase
MIFGAEDRARTGHPDLGKVVLYQMSYFRLYVEAPELPLKKNLYLFPEAGDSGHRFFGRQK